MQPHAEVISRLAAAAVLIHPSVTATDGDSEGGAPTILLEAQAIGTPIVTTRHADIPHVVPGGPGVWLCDEHDVDALGRALVAALQQQTPSSAAHVIAHHDIRAVAPRLEHMYARAGGTRAPRREDCPPARLVFSRQRRRHRGVRRRAVPAAAGRRARGADRRARSAPHGARAVPVPRRAGLPLSDHRRADARRGLPSRGDAGRRRICFAGSPTQRPDILHVHSIKTGVGPAGISRSAPPRHPHHRDLPSAEPRLPVPHRRADGRRQRIPATASSGRPNAPRAA